jgi:poly(A) polymerase
MRPGRDVGRALDFLLQLRLDEGSLGAEVATQRLTQWWAQQS